MPAAVLHVVAEVPAAPVLALMVLGCMVALVGHINKDARVVAIGLAVLFIATAGMLVGGYASFKGGETDPRPRKPPGEASY